MLCPAARRHPLRRAGFAVATAPGICDRLYAARNTVDLARAFVRLHARRTVAFGSSPEGTVDSWPNARAPLESHAENIRASEPERLGNALNAITRN